jgi:hypothetical protein
MAAPAVIRLRRTEDLEAFFEALQNLEGVTEEHLAVLRRAGSSVSGAVGAPRPDDLLGSAAYAAVVYRIFAETLADQQARIFELEAQVAKKKQRTSLR